MPSVKRITKPNERGSLGAGAACAEAVDSAWNSTARCLPLAFSLSIGIAQSIVPVAVLASSYVVVVSVNEHR